MSPLLWALTVILGLPDGRTRDLAREAIEWPDVVIERGMLASCPQAIREDIQRGSQIVRRGWQSVGKRRSHDEYR